MSLAATQSARSAWPRRRHRRPVPARPDFAAAAPASPWAQAEGEAGVVFARRRHGERALPCDGAEVLLSPKRLAHHVLIMGATGSGKSETALRLCWSLAQATDAPIFFLDAKGDERTAQRFIALMTDAGRRTHLFPAEPLDGWRGDERAIANRLLEVIDFADSGPAAWYRDIARAVVHLVCRHPAGPPRSAAQALERIDLDALRAAHPTAGALKALGAEQVKGVRLRYEAFFAQTGDTLDGRWAWEDAQAAYLLLDSLTLREETGALARYLLEDFSHYFARRKSREQFCVLVVDEFSAVAQSAGMATRIEQARAFNTGLILAPQVSAGMGDAAEAARILGSAETVICHRVNTPDPVIELAGTRRRIEYSTHYAPGGPTGEGSARVQHQFKVDPNDVRSLAPGEAYVINRGHAMKVDIHRAPDLPPVPAEPPAQALASPTTAAEPMPRTVSY